tara:strand:+ start:19118 stop:19300 length:183 start_codon:yes stop_codon:yes gene_type:complete
MFEFIKDYLHLCIVGWPIGLIHLAGGYLIYNGWYAFGGLLLVTMIAYCSEMILKEYAKYD